MEISAGNAGAKRRLRLELAGALSSSEVAREVRKRLTSIARAQSYIGWRKRKEFVKDLDAQRRAIVDKVAPEDPMEALDLMWRFLAIADPVFGRCDDSSGSVIGVFQDGLDDLVRIAEAAKPNVEDLADRILSAVQDNGYGQHDDVIAKLAPVLGPAGLAHLKAVVEALARDPVRLSDEDDTVVALGLAGSFRARDVVERNRERTVRMALLDIADATGDIDRYIALHDASTRKVPAIAAGIAQRLLDAGRVDEAMDALEATDTDPRRRIPDEWQTVRFRALEAAGREDEAQAARWASFERGLSPDDLRAYLKALPDFEDIEAEERALDHAARHVNVNEALVFLINWQAFGRAASVVVFRARELDGDYYEILTPAAEMLSAAHPLAATLLLRAMVDYALNAARSSRYRHAARHLIDCEALANEISDWGGNKPHETYISELRSRHPRKSSFWVTVDAAT